MAQQLERERRRLASRCYRNAQKQRERRYSRSNNRNVRRVSLKKETCSKCMYKDRASYEYPCRYCAVINTNNFVPEDFLEPTKSGPEYKLPEGCELYFIANPDWAARRYIMMAGREMFIPEIEGCSKFRGYLLVDPDDPTNYIISPNPTAWVDSDGCFVVYRHKDDNIRPAELKGVVWKEGA